MGLTTFVVLLGVFLPSLNGQTTQPVQSAKPARHSLYYVYTALSKPINAPGIYDFIGMGVLDGRKIDYYNSVDKKKVPEQNWMREKLPADYWEKGTQSRRSKEQWFKVNVNILMERNRQNGSDVHVLNWKHGCEVEEQPDGTFKFIRGADQYSYDGKDFLSFDDASMQWVAPVPEAIPTKQKWDGVPILNQYTKGYLEKECVDWLDKFVTYANGDLIAASPPKVHLFARPSKECSDDLSMTCMATGFLPKEIEMSIRKKEIPVYTAEHHHIYPNGDGTHQARLHVKVPRAEANDYNCFVNHRTLKAPVIIEWEYDGELCDESSPIAAIAGAAGAGVVVVAAVAGIIVYFTCYKKGNKTVEKKPKEGVSQMRIVLLGSHNAGKSSSVNTILGKNKFNISVRASECVKREGETAGRHITVVKVPGWRHDKTEPDKRQVALIASMCPPGPHALVLVINVSNSFTEAHKTAVQKHLELLGERVWSHTIVLFTQGAWLGDTSIEQHIERGGEDLKWVVEKCGNRYHVIENSKRDDGQVIQLLEKIEKMVAGNRGIFQVDNPSPNNPNLEKKPEEQPLMGSDSSSGGSQDSGLDRGNKGKVVKKPGKGSGSDGRRDSGLDSASSNSSSKDTAESFSGSDKDIKGSADTIVSIGCVASNSSSEKSIGGSRDCPV